jgi:hypothetical protein
LGILERAKDIKTEEFYTDALSVKRWQGFYAR